MPPSAAGHAVKPPSVHRNDAHRMQFGVLEQIPRPRIMAIRGDEDFQHRVRLMPQLGDDGVETVNEGGLGHGRARFGRLGRVFYLGDSLRHGLE